MMTLLQSALTGWIDYTQHGKFAAFLLLAILYLGFSLYGSGKRSGAVFVVDSAKLLYLYGGLITLGCICPVTALILLKYQTGFYSYVWIWAAVPQTALIAWAAADFLQQLFRERTLQNGIAAVILLGILFLGGNPVSEWVRAQTQDISAWETLEQLSAYSESERGTGEFALWAPKEIMAAARAYSAQIRPVYGRSIWEASLGSYSYDTNETWQEDMYLWMNHLETTGETEYLRTDRIEGTDNADGKAPGREIDFALCLDRAQEAGIDYILLPGDLPEETRQELQVISGAEWQPFDGYFLITLP